MIKRKVRVGTFSEVITLGHESNNGKNFCADLVSLAQQLDMDEEEFNTILIHSFNAQYLPFDKTLPSDHFPILGFINKEDANNALIWYESQLVAMRLRGGYIWFYV